MKKDFYRWHLVKAKINDIQNPTYFYEREIWFCSLGLNVGHEEDGKHTQFERPILVLKKFNKETFWGIALTTKHHSDPLYYFPFLLNGRLVFANLSQLRLLDSRRILRKAGMMSQGDFDKLRDIIKKLI